jgi:UDP-N-acetylglucosamine:LPS N-acetylglucosamine transferase
MVASLNDQVLREAMKRATTIIARSGYSTIMDLAVLGLLHKSELHPTPGQSEQEYLASRF